MKYLSWNQFYVGCDDGFLFKYFMNHKDPVFKCQILDDWITSMATTPVKKILFLCNMFGDYAELRTRNHKKINFGIDNVRRSEVANNGKFLITASTDNYARMTKWS